jgi:hypothetical protein
MAVTQRSQQRSEPWDLRRVVALIVGDTIAFLVFAAVGRASHAEAAGLGAFVQVLETAAPFLVGWFVAAPLAGAFRSDLAGHPRQLLLRTGAAWLFAWPIGLGLRSLIRQTSISPSFAIVTLITVLIILGVWRGIFGLAIARTAKV